MENKVEIRVNNDKYGIVDTATEQTIIPFEYDNIFTYHELDKEYILCKSGKFGAVYIESDNSYKWIAPCEYDTCDTFALYRDLIFSKEGEKRYYFWESKSCRNFSHIQYLGYYLFAIDTDSYYILRINTGEILWACSPKSPLNKFPCGDPCLVCMGEVYGLPLFHDCTNNGYILPQGKCGLEYCHDIPSTIKPIIVNGVNIVNIVGDSNGVNALEYIGRGRNNKIKCDYDEITIELKVKLKKGKHIEERCYQIPYGKFTADDVCDYSEW